MSPQQITSQPGHSRSNVWIDEEFNPVFDHLHLVLIRLLLSVVNVSLIYLKSVCSDFQPIVKHFSVYWVNREACDCSDNSAREEKRQRPDCLSTNGGMEVSSS